MSATVRPSIIPRRQQSQVVDLLAKAVAIHSVSGDTSYHYYVLEMADWIKGELIGLGVKVTFNDPGKRVLDGREIQATPSASLARPRLDTRAGRSPAMRFALRVLG